MLGRSVSPSKSTSASSRTRIPTKEPLSARRLSGDAAGASALPSSVPRATAGGDAPTGKLSSTVEPTVSNATAISPAPQRRFDSSTAGSRDRAGSKHGIVTASAMHPNARQAPSAVLSIPDWVKARPYLSGCQYLGPLSQVTGTPVTVKQMDILPLGSYPPAVQEILVVEDLLYCMMGLDGRQEMLDDPHMPLTARIIQVFALPVVGKCRQRSRRKPHSHVRSILRHLPIRSGKSYHTSGGLLREVCLCAFTSCLISLINDNRRVMRFVDEQSRFRSGLVNHAFAAAGRSYVDVAMFPDDLLLGQCGASFASTWCCSPSSKTSTRQVVSPCRDSGSMFSPRFESWR